MKRVRLNILNVSLQAFRTMHPKAFATCSNESEMEPRRNSMMVLVLLAALASGSAGTGS
jgi:hypothetical protein